MLSIVPERERKRFRSLGLTLVIAAIIAVVFFLRPVLNSERFTVNVRTGEFDAQQLRTMWERAIREKGALPTYQAVTVAYASESMRLQHFAVHVLGEVLFGVEGIGGMAVCDDAYAFGCYHGFISAAILGEGLEVISTLDRMCKEAYQEPTACQHGLGHGILEFLGHGHLLAALDACPKVSRTTPLGGCANGVFMAYNMPVSVDGSNVSFRFREVDPEHPYEPCPGISDAFFQNACYHQLVQLWLNVFGEDYVKVGVWCEKISSEAEQEACFRGVAVVAAPMHGLDPVKTREICRSMPTIAGELWCRQTAYQYILKSPRAGQADIVCSNLDVSGRRACQQE